MTPESFNDIVFESCSGYRGYSMNKAALKATFRLRAIGLRLVRVSLYASRLDSPLQTLLKPATARDQEASAAVAADALKNDPATLAIAPTIIDEVYSLGFGRCQLLPLQRASL